MTQKTDANAIFNDRRKHERAGMNYKVLFHVLDERAAIEEVGAMEAKNKALPQTVRWRYGGPLHRRHRRPGKHREPERAAATRMAC